MLVGFILTTVGGVNAYRNGVYHPQTTSQIGITLYALVLGALSGITARTLFSLHRVRPGDRRLIYAIAAGIPFLIVRLIYSLISVYERSRTFDPVRGSVVVYALMGVAMEFIVVAFYLAAGLLAPVIPKSATQPGDSEPLTGTEAAYMPSQDAEQQGSAPRVPDQQAGISLNR